MVVPRGRVRAALIGEQPMFFHALAHWLCSERDIEASYLAGLDGRAIDRCVAFAPDVTVIDEQSVNGTLPTIVTSLRAGLPAVKILLLADGGSWECTEAASRAGCDGIIARSESAERLAAMVRSSVLAGGTSCWDGGPDADVQERQRRLTAREREVLNLLAGGTSTAGIGKRLGIAHNTARAHVQRVIEKLGAHSKLEAVAIARRTGIIES